MFASNIQNKGNFNISDIFGNPIYERLIGSYTKVNSIFDGKFNNVLRELDEVFGFKKIA